MPVPLNFADKSYNHARNASRFGGSAIPAEPGGPHAVRVRLIHSCPLLRAGMAAILSAQADLHVSEHDAWPAYFLEECIVITDYACGIRTASQQRSQQPGCQPRVLIVTNRDKEWEVRQAVDSGVHGYLQLGCAAEELIRTVRLLSRGICYLSATAVRSVTDSLRRTGLTQREHDVLRVLARGGSDKLIARELGIGPGTVKSHVKHLLQKLDASARTQAVVVAIERGLLLDLDEVALAKPAESVSWPAPLVTRSVATALG